MLLIVAIAHCAVAEDWLSEIESEISALFPYLFEPKTITTTRTATVTDTIVSDFSIITTATVTDTITSDIATTTTATVSDTTTTTTTVKGATTPIPPNICAVECGAYQSGNWVAGFDGPYSYQYCLELCYESALSTTYAAVFTNGDNANPQDYGCFCYDGAVPQVPSTNCELLTSPAVDDGNYYMYGIKNGTAADAMMLVIPC